MTKPIKKAAVLHDLCGVGKAALTNMLPVLSVMGIEACPVPTMLLSTHTGGYGTPVIEQVSSNYIKNCADHYREQQVEFDAVFIGYLGNPKIVDAVLYFVKQFPKAYVILDPIMGDHGRYYSNFDAGYAQLMKGLLPIADIILPNLTECCLLSDRPYETTWNLQSLESLCHDLYRLGAKDMVITSIPDSNGGRGILLSESKKTTLFSYPDIPCDFHGSGDVFDGVFTASFLKGEVLPDCIQKAHTFVSNCISESMRYQYPKREGLIIEKSLSLLV